MSAETTGAGPDGAIPTVPFGRTALEVTRFVLGCAPLAGLYEDVSEEDAASTLGEAWRQGVRAFDTAPHYAAGVSERRVGSFLAGQPRDQFVLSTKVGRLLVEDEPAGTRPPEFAAEGHVRRVLDYSAAGVRRSLEDSLERLGLDRVDIALVHDPDDNMDEALDGAFPALAKLRDDGVVGAIGAGMNNCPPLERIVAEADVDCILVAGRYNLLDQDAGRQLFPLCRERGVAVLVAGVFASDVLVKPGPSAHFRYRPASQEIIDRTRSIEEVCRRHEVELGSAAMHLPLRHPAVTAVVVGARNAKEVSEDVGHFRATVPEALYTELSELGLIDAG